MSETQKIVMAIYLRKIDDVWTYNSAELDDGVVSEATRASAEDAMRAGHYQTWPIPGDDPRMPARRFTVGKFVPAEEARSR